MEEEVRRGWRDPELVPLFISAIRAQENLAASPIDSSLENMRIQVSR
jgi:hypothetical protein